MRLTLGIPRRARQPSRRAAPAMLAGDDWAVAGNLTDLDGSPLDLTAATIEWVLVDFNGAMVASFPGNASVAI
jgi:hypothetical protein